MNGLIKDISKESLHLETFNNHPRLTKGQQALLKAIRDCVSKSIPISWDIIVDCYYYNCRKKGKEWWGSRQEYDILEHYKLQGSKWQYTIRPTIRQWFVSSIGILTIKNLLIIIPTIELE